MTKKTEKKLLWVENSRKNLLSFPEDVKDFIGYALYHAQQGTKHPAAKPFKGFKGAGVLEIVDDYDGDTYRAVYTVKFKEKVYVLHAFQKKSKSGIKTPQKDIDLIQARYKQVEAKEKEQNDGRS